MKQLCSHLLDREKNEQAPPGEFSVSSREEWVGGGALGWRGNGGKLVSIISSARFHAQ